MKKLLFTFSVLFLFHSCSSEESPANHSFTTKKVQGKEILLLSDSTDAMAVPSWIKAVPGGFLLYDVELQNVAKFNYIGDRQLSFGDKGRGPGEFQSLSGIWAYDNRYWAYDINGRKLISYNKQGNHVKDYSLDFVEFPAEITPIELIGSQQFAMSTGGKDGALIKLADLENKHVRYVGKAVDSTSSLRQSMQDMEQAISSGRIPDANKNNVLMGSNESGLFVFEQFTGMLKKFSHAGKLLWQEDLKIPAITDLFDRIMDENRSRLNTEKMLLQFVYASGLSVTNEGAGVLLNAVGDQPAKVLWMSDDGQELTLVNYPDITNPSRLPLRFTITEDGSRILFSNTLSGKVFTAQWPIDDSS